MHITSYSIWQL